MFPKTPKLFTNMPPIISTAKVRPNRWPLTLALRRVVHLPPGDPLDRQDLNDPPGHLFRKFQSSAEHRRFLVENLLINSEGPWPRQWVLLLCTETRSGKSDRWKGPAQGTLLVEVELQNRHRCLIESTWRYRSLVSDPIYTIAAILSVQ